MTTDTTIRTVNARRVWDSRGRPTVEAEVHLQGGATGRAIVPAGASKGSREALELRDGGEAFGGLDVQRAIGRVNGEIARRLTGLAADDQAALDEALIALDGTPNKTRLGANATLAVSMAAAHAAAAAHGVPLYRYLRGDGDLLLPMPQIQIFGGGAHAGRRVDIQDFMVVCPSASTFAQALEWTADSAAVVWCQDDFPWQPDPQRDGSSARSTSQQILAAVFAQHPELPMHAVSGPFDERVQTVQQALD